MRWAEWMRSAPWLLLAALPLACGGAGKERRPTVLHEMPAPEIARCAAAAPREASFEVDQLVTEQGDVPAAWVRSQKAQKAVQLRPDSVAAHEALVRVCLSQKDDRCAVEELDAARKSPDAEARSAELAQLDEPVKAATERVAAADKEEQERKAAEAEAALQK